jgi:hypothetical protein
MSDPSVQIANAGSSGAAVPGAGGQGASVGAGSVPGGEPPSRGFSGWRARAEAWLEQRPQAQLALQTLYYLALFAVLILMYGRGDFSTPPFVYQEF